MYILAVVSFPCLREGRMSLKGIRVDPHSAVGFALVWFSAEGAELGVCFPVPPRLRTSILQVLTLRGNLDNCLVVFSHSIAVCTGDHYNGFT